MTDTLNQQSSGAFALLVAFSWGATGENTANYTDWDNDVVVGGVTYSSSIGTRMRVDAATQTGGAKEEAWTVTMPPVVPLTYLARDCVFTQVSCTISEVDPTAATLTPNVMWSGVVTQSWQDPREAPGAIKVEVSGMRVNIQYPMGIESKTQCARTFGDQWCGMNIAAIQQTTEITLVAGKIISAPGLTIPSGKPNTYWNMGTVAYDGLSIAIADGTAGVSALKLEQVVPPEWQGVSAVFTPGCTKLLDGLSGCTAWENQSRFFGIGYAKPTGTPLIYPR